MARIIPSSPVGTSTSETLKLFRLLKHLPEENLTVWHRLTIHAQPAPDFWILHGNRRALFLSVATETWREVELLHQGSWLNQASISPALTASSSLDEETSRVTQPNLTTHADVLPAHATAVRGGSNSKITGAQKLADLERFRQTLSEPVPAVMVFPNLTEAQLRQARDVLFGAQALAPDLYLRGKNDLEPARFAQWVMEQLGDALSETAVTELRRTFAPEVNVPVLVTARVPIQRNLAPRLTRQLLDYDQEWVLKHDLDLSPEGQALVKEFGIHLLNGVAGSGKSLILLYRAHLLRRLYPQKRLLVLTHNRPLIRELEARYYQLQSRRQASQPSGEKQLTEWRTFHSWCHHLWPAHLLPYRRPFGRSARERILQPIWVKHLQGTAISPAMLAAEIDWYKDRLLFSREQYVTADRTGRGFALTETMRHRVYDAIASYEQTLADQHKLDWGDVPRLMWRWVNEGKFALPQYDFVLVDEAQFFAPIWFELIKRMVKPQTGQLFLAADPTQGFLQRRQSWLASGLEVRGHSTFLPRSYRTTRQILDCATRFYQARLPQDDDDIILPVLTDLPEGHAPQMVALTSGQDELTYVVNEVRELVQAQIQLRHILIIHVNYNGRDQLKERLRRALGTGRAADPSQTAWGDYVRVCLMNNVTGLESPIVFLVGLQELFEQEQSIRLTEDERRVLMRDNTRKLYMAMTRAGQRLVMTFNGTPPEWFCAA